MPLLSEYAQRKKIEYFLKPIPPDAAILEIGCGSRWVGEYLKSTGRLNYTGLDLVPPADIVGDVNDWRRLGIAPESFDVIIAFEVVEHVDCFQACYDMLKPGGRMLITTPLPSMDWALRIMEALGLNQKRTSPHNHLVRLADVPGFEKTVLRTVGFLSQWAILTKPRRASA